MDLAHIVLLQLSYLTFLGSVAEKIEIAPGERKKWSILLSRARRDLNAPSQNTAQLTDATSGSFFVKPEDTKDVLKPHSSNDAHIRVKRYRHSPNFHHFQSVRVGCRFGTCTVQNLAHQIFQYTDKDKDGTAPVSKISPQGYGRRRRSVPDKKLLLPVVDGKIKPWWVSSKVRMSDDQHQLLDLITTSRLSQDKTKGKLWESLLRT